MKVLCVNYGYKSPLATTGDYVKEGAIYTVRCEETGFSEYAQRIVEAYGFEEIKGLYEKGMFISLSDFDELLIHCLKTKPLRISEVDTLRKDRKNTLQEIEDINKQRNSKPYEFIQDFKDQ